ncbi:MAG TPA: RNA methyltransferase [Burkholderiaceae bacterium]|nr:RNA methyltransferase [Burkholderiaceae bacterium]
MSSSIKAISSRDNSLLVRLRKLAADPAAYRKLGEVWVEGEHLCSAFAQRGGVAAQAVISEAGWQVPALRALAGTAAAVAVVPEALMPGLSALESPPPLAFALPWAGPGELDATTPSVVLDRLQDAGNVGNILRSAAAFGFPQVIALKGTAALWSPKVLRAGMGAHFGLRLVEGAEVDALAALELPLLATSSHATLAIHESSLPWPCAWVLGHEGQGVAAALLRRCAQTLRIAQPGGEESLNVAAAAAVCLHESVRQRG